MNMIPTNYYKDNYGPYRWCVWYFEGGRCYSYYNDGIGHGPVVGKYQPKDNLWKVGAFTYIKEGFESEIEAYEALYEWLESNIGKSKPWITY